MSNESVSFSEYTYLMNRIAYWLVNNNKKFNVRQIYNYFNRVADYGTIIKAIKERGTNYQSDSLIAEFVECAIVDNKDLSFMPNYVTRKNGEKLYLNTIVSMASRASAYEVMNNRSPAIVYIQSPKQNSTTSTTLDATLKAFIDKFGDVNTIDESLAKIKGRKYLKYFDSAYNTATTLNRIWKMLGVNCTDAAQYFYRIGIALGYEVQFVHVKCRSSGTGHVRLRLKHSKHTGGNWIYRDPAAVLNGESITSNWCSNGYLIAYNPSWIFSDLYQ